MTARVACTQGVDLSTASFTSELEHITGPLTNHIMSAEMHNQSINSMALVSARTTAKALQLLQVSIAQVNFSTPVNGGRAFKAETRKKLQHEELKYRLEFI